MVLRLFVRDIVFYHILFTYFSRFLPCSGDDNNAIGFLGQADPAPTLLFPTNSVNHWSIH